MSDYVLERKDLLFIPHQVSWAYEYKCRSLTEFKLKFLIRFLTVKVKVKQSRYRPEQAQRMDRGIALSFRDLSTRRGGVVSITPRPL
jgi:hypothetical protein